MPSGFVPDPLSPISESVFPRRSLPTSAVSLQRSQAPLIFARHLPTTSAAKLFTPEELAVLPTDVLSRQKYKQQAKKAKKRRMATEKTQDELMLGSMGIGMDEPEPELEESGLRVTTKKMKKAMKKIVKPTAMEVDEEVQKEADFANFLATMGGESFALI